LASSFVEVHCHRVVFFKNTILFFARENLHVRLLIYLVALPKNFAFKFISEFSSQLFLKVFFSLKKVKSAMAQICRRAFLHRLRQIICGFGILIKLSLSAKKYAKPPLYL